jgi:hypothetical protein
VLNAPTLCLTITGSVPTGAMRGSSWVSGSPRIIFPLPARGANSLLFRGTSERSGANSVSTKPTITPAARLARSAVAIRAVNESAVGPANATMPCCMSMTSNAVWAGSIAWNCGGLAAVIVAVG